MTAPDERVPRPPALHDASAHRSRPAEAWFTYTAAGDAIVWSEELGAMLGRRPAADDVSRQVLARYVHRDDQARALGAITRAWTSREPVTTTLRLVRADGGWFDVDCRIEALRTSGGVVHG